MRIPATVEALTVENARLQKIVTNLATERDHLKIEVRELTQQLGQAAAGMELADLIKRMIS